MEVWSVKSRAVLIIPLLTAHGREGGKRNKKKEKQMGRKEVETKEAEGVVDVARASSRGTAA